ncbi:hypothetical protein FOZ60_013512 [Perkinsus olseni]|uniref:Biotin holocarboxylase synthetase n=2 Tax=Perkinsus olseni TaxID=32597 RepID=A0A7J6P8I8_PEROL|nr:hypothetical protein FOZ60_013512 [Perkinsus olseni]
MRLRLLASALSLASCVAQTFLAPREKALSSVVAGDHYDYLLQDSSTTTIFAIIGIVTATVCLIIFGCCIASYCCELLECICLYELITTCLPGELLELACIACCVNCLVSQRTRETRCCAEDFLECFRPSSVALVRSPMEASASWPRKVHRDHYEEVTSTQTIVKDMLRDLGSLSVDDVYCVSADTQTEGKGRGNRRWISSRGCAMQSILIFVEESQAERCWGLSEVMAVSVAEVIDGFMGRGSCRNTQLKWPNDIIINGMKVGGILRAEAITDAGSKEGKIPVVVGVGVNVDVEQEILEQLKRVRWPATSLRSCEGCDWRADLTVPNLREAILEQFVINARLWREELESCYISPVVLHKLTGRQVMVGEKIRVRDGDGRIMSGLHSGVDEHGYLIVTLADGKREVLARGEFLYGDDQPTGDT